MFMLRSLEPLFLLGASGALKIVKNGLELRKLELPKLEGVKNSKKTNHQTLQSLFPITQIVGYIWLLNHGWVYKHLTEGLSLNYENKMYIILYD
jgi:hypothetical protein